MANYSYETLQRMSAHPWEGLKPGQRKAVRNFNRKEGASEPEHGRGSEHEHEPLVPQGQG